MEIRKTIFQNVRGWDAAGKREKKKQPPGYKRGEKETREKKRDRNKNQQMEKRSKHSEILQQHNV